MERDEDIPGAFRPEKVIPVDPRQFAFALQLGSAAQTYRMPMRSPAEEGLSLASEDGTVVKITFKDVPTNRHAFAIRDHFAQDHKTYMSVMMRFFALERLRNSERMKQWVRKHPDDREAILMHQAVFVAGATLPLNDDGWFDEEAFFAKVEEVARSMDEEDAGKSKAEA